MLAVKHYEPAYIDRCKARIAAQVSAYDAGAAKSAPESFEVVFFNNMVMVLENMFMHRMRGQEGKDGNPLNEVRVLCASMVDNDYVLQLDKTIKLDSAKSVLGYEAGDQIAVTKRGFLSLSEAFFAEIQKRFG